MGKSYFLVHSPNLNVQEGYGHEPLNSTKMHQLYARNVLELSQRRRTFSTGSHLGQKLSPLQPHLLCASRSIGVVPSVVCACVCVLPL